MQVETSKKIRTNVYLDESLKQQAQEIFKHYHIGLSDAFNIFLAQSVMQKGIPFEIKIPNDETLKTIKEARVGKNIKQVTLEEFKKDISA